jgi:hypothetical protein
MGALQGYVGCLGPGSGAEDLDLGEPPQGWDNQLVNRALGNLNYEYCYKLLVDAADQYFIPGRYAQGFSVGGQAASSRCC